MPESTQTTLALSSAQRTVLNKCLPDSLFFSSSIQSMSMCVGMCVYTQRETEFLASLTTVCASTFRSRDFYHTCYCLSGLSVAQHFGSGDFLHDVVLGVPENRLVSCALVELNVWVYVQDRASRSLQR